jgi:uncharacterized membrane protein YbhN (UPF0104 family)
MTAPQSEATAASLGAAPTRQRKWGSLAARWVPLALVVLGCVYLGRTVDVAALEASLLTVRPWPLGMALVFAALGVVAHAAYWWVLVNTASPVGLRAMVIYSFASYATNTFVPMRAGEALRVWLIQRRHGVPVRMSAAVIALEKIADVASLLILVTPLAWLIPDLPPSVAQALRILPCIVLAGVVAVAIASRHHVRWSFLEGFAVVRRPAVIGAGFGFILLAWVFDVCAILSVLLAVHVTPTLEEALLVILCVNIAIAIPATPGQVGTHELGSTIALRMVGVPEAQAIPFALFYHATQLLPILLIGLTSARALSKEADAPPGLESRAEPEASSV